MSLFKKHTVLPIPDGFTAEDIKLESSICTGEKSIGFCDRTSGRLVCAELVRSAKDIEAFCKKYGIDNADSLRL